MTVTTEGERRFDIVIVGGTPGGIAAALSAGRAGRHVLLIDAHR
ncbi:MAG: FAD-dependent oxidoreductase, partial [Planctomycetota bacterium]|nr:FAD-dependent oxidoreductase [Planctomycetota bacterium]